MNLTSMTNMLSRAHPLLLSSCCTRCLSTSVIKFADKQKENQLQNDRLLKRGNKRRPWDKRFPVSSKDINPSKEGGSYEMTKLLPENLVARAGIVDKQTKRFIPVPEMIPEFVVPDLTDFPLKPYVTYTAKEITQNVLTPKDVFDSVYAGDIEDAVKAGKIKVQDGKVYVDDGRVLDIKTGQRSA